MNIKVIVGSIACSAVLGYPVLSIAYESFQGPTELIQYDPAKTFDGYTLFSPFRGKNTYLINMQGEVVHTWPYPEGWVTGGQEVIEKHARLLENGTLFRGFSDRRGFTGNQSNVVYQISNWDGEVIWEYDESRPGYAPHHDFRVIWNPKLQQQTILYVASRDISDEEARAIGVDPKGSEDISSRPDGLVEIDMQGNVIWEWNVSDHVIQDKNPDVLNYGVVADNPGKLDPNWGAGVGGDWIHINALDYNEVLDQIVISNSSHSEIQIIDHGATFVAGDPEASIELAAGDAGDFIYRWGNPCAFDAGDCPSLIDEGRNNTNGHQQLFFIHDAQWIREKEMAVPGAGNLPGEGNLLIFDNGTRKPGVTHSSVYEINPYAGRMADGEYVAQMDGGYKVEGGSSPQNISTQIVWEFKSTMSNSFYSEYISGAQRLENGNTFINSGANGHFFEVTPEGEVVWEYINPVGVQSSGEYGIYRIMTDTAGRQFNSVFRAARYSADYPGLNGRDLVPMGQITEIHSAEPAAPSWEK